MIGGRDILIEVPAGRPALDCAVRTIRLFWPRAVFENAITSELALRYEEMRFSDLREILAYRDMKAFHGWQELGADPSLNGTMIHLLASAGDLTLVVDEHPVPEIAAIIASVRHALWMNSFGIPPAKEAA